MESVHLEHWNVVDCLSFYSSVWLKRALFSRRFRWRFCNLTSMKWSMTLLNIDSNLCFLNNQRTCPSSGWNFTEIPKFRPPGTQKLLLSRFYRYSARRDDGVHRAGVKMRASCAVPSEIPYVHRQDRTSNERTLLFVQPVAKNISYVQIDSYDNSYFSIPLASGPRSPYILLWF